LDGAEGARRRDDWPEGTVGVALVSVHGRGAAGNLHLLVRAARYLDYNREVAGSLPHCNDWHRE
jgi:hypothetical protein